MHYFAMLDLPCRPGPNVNKVENYFSLRENENTSLQHRVVSKHREAAWAEWKYRRGEGETNDVLFSEFPLTHTSLKGQNGWFTYLVIVRKIKLTFKISSNFGRCLPNEKTGDNLFSPSLLRTLSQKGEPSGWGSWGGRGVRKEENFYLHTHSSPATY